MLQIVLFLAVAIAAQVWHSTASLEVLLAAVVLFLTGAALVLLGRRDIGFFPSPFPKPAKDGHLVTNGIYGQVRHPIYVGVTLMAVAIGLARASLAAIMLSVALVVVLDLKARREEAWLRERYPEYEAYAARTKRFVPFLY